jgi:acyl-coenzyme A thioesterase PaaI-like protein
VAVLAVNSWQPPSKPAPGDLLAECRLIKLGRRFAVGTVILTASGDAAPVAHLTATYSIPPQ